MIKLALRGARANLGRLILTLISVVLGVAFVSGSFVLADSLRSIFDQVSEDAFAGVDAQVRGIDNGMNSTDGERPRFDDGVVSTIAELPEARYTEGGLFSFERAYTIDSNDEVVAYIVDRYGEYVLLRPTLTGSNLLLWLAGPAMALLGLGVAVAYLRRQSRRRGEADAASQALSAAEQARLDEIMKD